MDRTGDVIDEALHWQVIAQAEGLLSVRRGLDIIEAAQALRDCAASRCQRVSEAAEDVVELHRVAIGRD